MTDASIEQANEIHCYEYSSSNVLSKTCSGPCGGVFFDDIEALLASSGFLSKQEVAPSYRDAQVNANSPSHGIPGVRTRH